MEWARNVARTEEMRYAHNIFVVKPEGREHYGDIGVDTMDLE
jgi:hypothetical protein